MSRIKAAANGQKDNKIVKFLEEEGFKEDSWHGGNCYQFVACGRAYCAWVNVFSDYIDLYAEYDCGGEVASYTIEFEPDNFDDFQDKYERVLDFVRRWTVK
jgi:hypothetical protein